MSISFRSYALFLVLSLSATGRSAVVPTYGYGAMGDSLTATRPPRTFDDSWVPWLSLVRGMDFGGPGDPYNVSIAGIETDGLLQRGQHTATRNNVLAGNVDIAYYACGNNDLIREVANIKSGLLSGPILNAWVNQRVNNIATALDTVLSANPVGMVLMGVADITLTPAGRDTYTTPLQISRAVNAVNVFNAGIEQLARDRQIPYVDLAAAMRYLGDGPITVGGVSINVTDQGGPTGTDYYYYDGIHPSWVGNAILANMLLEAVNVGYHTDIPKITDLEILQNTGIANRYTGETWSTNVGIERTFIRNYAVPEANTWVLVGLAMMLGVWRWLGCGSDRFTRHRPIAENRPR